MSEAHGVRQGHSSPVREETDPPVALFGDYRHLDVLRDGPMRTTGHIFEEGGAGANHLTTSCSQSDDSR